MNDGMMSEMRRDPTIFLEWFDVRRLKKKMPCLILTGYPSSGKSTLAELFRERALLCNDKTKNATRIEHVVIVTEATACPDQTTRACYSDSQAEKATRSALKAEFDRAVGAATGSTSSSDADSSKTLIILDSMNYIKGFRYELHCISKAAKERHAVVWVMNDVAVSKQWNEHRRQQQQSTLTKTNDESDDGFYTNEQMDELILRYEPPDARNRWDKPLYRVDMRPLSSQPQTTPSTTSTPGDSSSNNNQQQQQQGLAKETLERSVYNMHDLSEAIHLQQETTIHTVAPSNKKTTSMGGFKRAASSKVKSSQNNNNNNNNTNAPATPPLVENEALEEIAQTSSPSRLLSLEERVDAILDSFLNHVQPLQQSFSTQEQLASSDANLLQKVDMVTQLACQAIVAAQSKQQLGGGGDGGKLAIHLQQQQPQQRHQQEGEKQLWLNCSRGIPWSWTELQRLRKQYLQWVKSQPPRDTTQRGIAQSFLKYIEASSQE